MARPRARDGAQQRLREPCVPPSSYIFGLKPWCGLMSRVTQTGLARLQQNGLPQDVAWQHVACLVWWLCASVLRISQGGTDGLGIGMGLCWPRYCTEQRGGRRVQKTGEWRFSCLPFQKSDLAWLLVDHRKDWLDRAVACLHLRKRACRELLPGQCGGQEWKGRTSRPTGWHPLMTTYPTNQLLHSPVPLRRAMPTPSPLQNP